MKRRTKTTRIVLHHSESPGGNADFIKAIHLQNGWADIGYHYIILNGKDHGDWQGGRDGDIEPGRDLALQGAHARGANADSVGICLIGSLMEKMPTAFQIGSLIRLCADLCIAYDLDPLEAIIGHRDVCSTDCPGDNFYTVLMPPTKMLQYAVKWRIRMMEGGEK